MTASRDQMNYQERGTPAAIRLDSDRKCGNALASVPLARNQTPVLRLPRLARGEFARTDS